MNMNMNKTLIVSTIGMALLGADAANAGLVTGVLGNGTWSTNHANFTMLTSDGATVGGTNDVSMMWDGDAFTANSDYIGPGSYSNVTASSTSTFFGHTWAAHDIQVFTPGSYSFDTALGGGNPESGILNVSVPAGMIGMHMLFDWGGNNNIDVFVVAASNSMYGAGVKRVPAYQGQCDQTASNTAPVIDNCLWNLGVVSGHAPTANQIWMLATTDGNGDGVMGIPMAAGGPFAGFNAGFNANLDSSPTVPVPATAWLFGSGVAGLLGAARRRRPVADRS